MHSSQSPTQPLHPLTIHTHTHPHTKNLTPLQYVSEAVAAVAEAPPTRAADTAAAVEVTSVLHQTYPEFGVGIGPALAKAFGGRLAGGGCFVGCLLGLGLGLGLGLSLGLRGRGDGAGAYICRLVTPSRAPANHTTPSTTLHPHSQPRHPHRPHRGRPRLNAPPARGAAAAGGAAGGARGGGCSAAAGGPPGVGERRFPWWGAALLLIDAIFAFGVLRV